MRVIWWPCNIVGTREHSDLSDNRGDVPLSSEEGTTNTVIRTLARKMVQAEARIWPWLSYLCRIRSTAAMQKR